MSEVKNRVTTEVLGDLFKSNFEKLSPRCPDRIVDDRGEVVCCYHSDSATDCRFGICPKMDLSLNESAELLEKTEGREREIDSSG